MRNLVKTILSISCFVILSTSLYAQKTIKVVSPSDIKSIQQVESIEITNSSEQIEKTVIQADVQIYPVTYSVGRNKVQREHNKEYYEEQLQNLNNQIEAIEYKIEYIKSDQSMREKAEENGWFQQMEEAKQQAKLQILELQEKINTHE